MKRHCAERPIAVAMACADCEVRGVIRFLQAEILGYLAEELSCGIVLLHDNSRPHTSRQTNLAA